MAAAAAVEVEEDFEEEEEEEEEEVRAAIWGADKIRFKRRVTCLAQTKIHRKIVTF